VKEIQSFSGKREKILLDFVFIDYWDLGLEKIKRVKKKLKSRYIHIHFQAFGFMRAYIISLIRQT